MKFSLYYSRPFIEIIESVYDIREVLVLPLEPAGYIPFFCANKPFKQGLIFNLPFNFYQTAEYFRNHWCGDEWQRIRSYADERRKNITITTVGELELEQGRHCANNPILQLSDVTNPADKYSRNLKSNLRKEWNKCRRHGIELSASRDEGDLRRFYRVLATQYVREHQMVFQPFSLYRRFHASGIGTLIVAKREGHVVGGLFLLSDQEVLHYNWGARTKVDNVSIGTLLIDYGIQHAKSQGYATFDFGSTPLSDKHLLDFKTRWGCDNYPVFKYYTTNPPAQIDLSSSFVRVRRLYSRLPIRVAAALMPSVVPWLVS